MCVCVCVYVCMCDGGGRGRRGEEGFKLEVRGKGREASGEVGR